MEYKVVSIFLLELAKFLPAFKLMEEYPSFCILSYTGFPFPIFKKILVLPRMLEDVEPEFDGVARPTFITNESFVGFSLYPQIFFDLFRVIRVERGRNWGTRARTFDLSMFYGYVSAYSDCYEKTGSYSNLSSNPSASIALYWAISSLWRTRSLCC